VPFLIKSRRPLSFSSTFVCVRSVFQIAINNGWCLSLKARFVDVVEVPLLTPALFDEDFSSRWESFELRDDRWSWPELKIFFSFFI